MLLELPSSAKSDDSLKLYSAIVRSSVYSVISLVLAV